MRVPIDKLAWDKAAVPNSVDVQIRSLQGWLVVLEETIPECDCLGAEDRFNTFASINDRVRDERDIGERGFEDLEQLPNGVFLEGTVLLDNWVDHCQGRVARGRKHAVQVGGIALEQRPSNDNLRIIDHLEHSVFESPVVEELAAEDLHIRFLNIEHTSLGGADPLKSTAL